MKCFLLFLGSTASLSWIPYRQQFSSASCPWLKHTHHHFAPAFIPTSPSELKDCVAVVALTSATISSSYCGLRHWNKSDSLLTQLAQHWCLIHIRFVAEPFPKDWWSKRIIMQPVLGIIDIYDGKILMWRSLIQRNIESKVFILNSELCNDLSNQTQALKQSRPYATSNTLFVCNGGPAREVKLLMSCDSYTVELWREQRLIFHSASFGLHQTSPRVSEHRVADELENEVHLLYSAIYFSGKEDGHLAADKNPSQRSYQVASRHRHTQSSTRLLIIRVC